MKYLILILVLFASAALADSPYLISPKHDGYLPNSTTGKYLGNLNNNKYDPNSVSNPYGQYGSKYSSDSINNPYGRYGSKYSNDSPNNPYATNPPKIIHNDDYKSGLYRKEYSGE